MDHSEITHQQIEARLNKAGEALHDLSMSQCELMILLLKKLNLESVDCSIKVPFYSTSGFTTLSLRKIHFRSETTELLAETAEGKMIAFHDLMPLIQNLIINTIYVSCYVELCEQ